MVLNLLCSCIKQNRNGSTFIRFTVYCNFAMVVLNSMLHDRQTKTGAAGLLGMALIHTIETLKYFLLMFGSNADASILHAQQNFTGLLCNGHFHTAAEIVVLNGIVTKVVNDLVQQSADTIDNTIIAGHFQRYIFQLCGICKCFTDFLRKNFERKIFVGHFCSFIQLRQADNIVNQKNKSGCFLADVSYKAGNIFGFYNAVLHQFHRSNDGLQRRFQFVRYIGSKLLTVLFSVRLLGHVKGEDHHAMTIAVRINAAQIKLILSAVFLGTEIGVSLCLCFLQSQPHILLAVYGQKIFSYAGNTSSKQCKSDRSHVVL